MLSMQVEHTTDLKPTSFGFLILHRTVECRLVRRNGSMFLLRDPSADNGSDGDVETTFANSHEAWDYISKLPRPTVLVADGAFLVKTINNRFALYAPTVKRVHPWDVIHHHKLLRLIDPEDDATPTVLRSYCQLTCLFLAIKKSQIQPNDGAAGDNGLGVIPDDLFQRALDFTLPNAVEFLRGLSKELSDDTSAVAQALDKAHKAATEIFASIIRHSRVGATTAIDVVAKAVSACGETGSRELLQQVCQRAVKDNLWPRVRKVLLQPPRQTASDSNRASAGEANGSEPASPTTPATVSIFAGASGDQSRSILLDIIEIACSKERSAGHGNVAKMPGAHAHQSASVGGPGKTPTFRKPVHAAFCDSCCQAAASRFRTSVVRDEDEEVAFLKSMGAAVDAQDVRGQIGDGALGKVDTKAKDDLARRKELAPVLESEFGYGDQPSMDRVNDLVAAGHGGILALTLLDDVQRTATCTGSQDVVAVFYDASLIFKAEIEHEKDELQKPEKHRSSGSRRAEFENWMVQLLISPLSTERKAWFCAHIACNEASVQLDIRARTSGAGANLVAYALARALPINSVSDILKNALHCDRLEAARACFDMRKNRTYGLVSLRSEEHSLPKEIHSAQIKIAHRPPSNADLYLMVTRRFADFVTHVEVIGLDRADDDLLKWFAEYTFRFPWRFIVLYDCDTRNNYPEVRERIWTSPDVRRWEPQTTCINFGEDQSTHLQTWMAAWCERVLADNRLQATEKRGDWEAVVSQHFKGVSESDKNRPSLVLVVTPPGAGKSFMMGQVEKELQRSHSFFKMDCSSDTLVKVSMKPHLIRSCPEGVKLLFVGDEYHFLNVSKRKDLFAFFKTHMRDKTVILIANRSDGEDDKLITQLQARYNEDRNHIVCVGGRLSEHKAVAVAFDTQVVGNARVPLHAHDYVRAFIGAFHCARRALFSDEACTHRDREAIVNAAALGPEALEMLCDSFGDKMASAGPFARQFPRIFHRLFTFAFGKVQQAVAGCFVLSRDDYVAKMLQPSWADPRDLLVAVAMACLVSERQEPKPADVAALDRHRDAVLPFVDFRSKFSAIAANTVAAAAAATNQASKHLHPAVALAAWSQHCLDYFGIRVAYTVDAICAKLREGYIVDQVKLPLIYGFDAGKATDATECDAVKHSVDANNLEEIFDCVKRGLALDWNDDIRPVWRTSYITDIKLVSSIFTNAPDKGAVLSSIDPDNLVVLLRLLEYDDLFARQVMQLYPDAAIQKELTRVNAPFLSQLWRSFREKPDVETWCNDGECERTWLARLPAARVRPELELLRWASLYAGNVVQVTNSPKERERKLQAIIHGCLREHLADADALEYLRPVYADGAFAHLASYENAVTHNTHVAQCTLRMRYENAITQATRLLAHSDPNLQTLLSPVEFIALAKHAPSLPAKWCDPGAQLLWRVAHGHLTPADVEELVCVRGWATAQSSDVVRACLDVKPRGEISCNAQERLAAIDVEVDGVEWTVAAQNLALLLRRETADIRLGTRLGGQLRQLRVQLMNAE
jgi:hypothetical protein